LLVSSFGFKKWQGMEENVCHSCKWPNTIQTRRSFWIVVFDSDNFFHHISSLRITCTTLYLSLVGISVMAYELPNKINCLLVISARWG